METHVVTQMRTTPGGGLGSSWSIGLSSITKLVTDLTWVIVMLVCSKAKLQFDLVQKKADATHESK